MNGPTRETLSLDQRQAYDEIMRWVQTRSAPYLTLGGLAGTGKTTVVSVLANELVGAAGFNVVFTAFTGKACDVLGRKLKANGIEAPCMTLHSLMYDPMEEFDGGVSWAKLESLPYDLIIVDEASMVGADLWNDLCSFKIPILAVGDHGQLPPVGAGTITLMQEPHLRLEKIHRQAEGDPILTLAHHVRQTGYLTLVPGIEWYPTFSYAAPLLAYDFNAAGICYYNATRVALNQSINEYRAPAVADWAEQGDNGGDFVICLQNNRRVSVFNGMRGIIKTYSEPDDRQRTRAQIEFPDHDRTISAPIFLPQFGREKTITDVSEWPWARRARDLGLLFDFGYVMTCHKVQGSQWDTAVVQIESSFRDTLEQRARWAYTAVTRASKRLILIGGQ